MRKILLTAMLLTTITLFGQTKQELIDAIIKENRMDSEQIGGSGIMSPVYANYQKLMKLITDDELLALAKHKNAVLRMYAIQGLISRGIGDIPSLFENELEAQETVETMIGCSLGDDLTYYIIYNPQMFSSDLKIFEASQKQLDEIVINSNKFVWWLMYDHIFKNNLDTKFLPRIEQLAFKNNNSFAFTYLKNNYYSQYESRINDYLLNVFPKQKFVEPEEYNKDNDAVFLRNFIDILLESGRSDYKAIAITKLRENLWLDERDRWFRNTLEKYGIQL